MFSAFVFAASKILFHLSVDSSLLLIALCIQHLFAVEQPYLTGKLRKFSVIDSGIELEQKEMPLVFENSIIITLILKITI